MPGVVLLLSWGAVARAGEAEKAQPPAAAGEAAPPAAPEGKPADGQTPPAAEGEKPPAEGEQKPPAAGEGEQPAEEARPSPEPAPERKPGPPLAVTGIGSLEILPRDYEESARYYIEVLGFREEDASGGEGERRCTLVSGPVRITLKEQPGKPIRPKRSPWLGVYPGLLSEVAAEAAGLKKAQGVLVDDLVPQGPASTGGIFKGDIILAVEGKATSSPAELTALIRGFAVGKKVLVTVWREGKKRDVPVELPASPFPEQLGPVAIRLQVRDLEDYYREALRRNLRLHAEPREVAGGGRILELVDPNDLLVILEEPPAGAEPPAHAPAPTPDEGEAKPSAPAPGEAAPEQPPAPPNI